MTGLEVWYLIAPILAKHLPLDKSDEARDAYVIAYIALKNYQAQPANRYDQIKKLMEETTDD